MYLVTSRLKFDFMDSVIFTVQNCLLNSDYFVQLYTEDTMPRFV